MDYLAKVQVDGLALQSVPKNLQTVEIVKAAIRQNRRSRIFANPSILVEIDSTVRINKFIKITQIITYSVIAAWLAAAVIIKCTS